MAIFNVFAAGRPLAPLLLTLAVVLLPATPALAQSTPEEADGANKTADSSGECVRPSMPGNGDPGVEGAMAYTESQQLYQKCLERLEGDESDNPKSEDPGNGTGGNIIDANENATQPEECARPDTPDGDGSSEGADYVEQREASTPNSGCASRPK